MSVAPKITVAYIDSPLQALNLLDYSIATSTSFDLIFINGMTEVAPANLSQILSVSDLIPSKRKEIIDHYPSIKSIIATRAVVNKACNLINFECFDFVCGEYRSVIFRSIARRLYKSIGKIVLLDDGTATLRIDRNARKPAKSVAKEVLFYALGLSAAPPDSVVFYSVYPIASKIKPSDKLIPASYQGLRGLLQDGDEDGSFYIGSPLYEAGVVTQEADKEILGRTIALLKRIPHAIYIPHRRERPEKLALIKAAGIEVRDLGMPFELYCVKAKIKNIEIYGTYSSLFKNIAVIYCGSCTIKSFRIEPELILQTWRDFVSDIYKDYSNIPQIQISPLP